MAPVTIDETSPFAKGLAGAFEGYTAGQEEVRKEESFGQSMQQARFGLARQMELAQQENEDRQRRNAAFDATQKYEAQLRPLNLESLGVANQAAREKLNTQSIIDEDTAKQFEGKPDVMKAQQEAFEQMIAGLGPLDEAGQQHADIARGLVARQTTPENQAKAIAQFAGGLSDMQNQRVRNSLADQVDASLRQGHFESDPEIEQQLGPIRDALRAGKGDPGAAFQQVGQLIGTHTLHVYQKSQRERFVSSISKELDNPDLFDPHTNQYASELNGISAGLQTGGLTIQEAQRERLRAQRDEIERKAKGTSSYEYTPGKAYAEAHTMAMSELKEGLIKPGEFQGKMRSHMDALLQGSGKQPRSQLPFINAQSSPQTLSSSIGQPAPSAPAVEPSVPRGTSTEGEMVNQAVNGALQGKSFSSLGLDPKKFTPAMQRQFRDKLDAVKQARRGGTNRTRDQF